MIDALGYVIAALIWMVALWRIPGAMAGDARRRGLAGCLLCFALALTVKRPPVVAALNSLGVVDLPVLLKHILATVAIPPILMYVVAMYGDAADQSSRGVAVARWITRTATKAAAAAVLLMVVLFFTVVDRAEPSQHFVSDHLGEPGATAYVTVVYLYLGAATAAGLYQWWPAAKRANDRLLRIGLRLMALSMLSGVLYVATRFAYLYAALWAVPSEETVKFLYTVTQLFQIALFLLLAAGTTIPACTTLVARYRAYRAVMDLYPIWADLARAVPQYVFKAPRSRLVDLARLEDPIIRLDRFVTEIRDAMRDLRHFAAEDLGERSLARAKSNGLAGEQAAAAAEAIWIEEALAAKRAGKAEASAAPFTSGVGEDADLQREIQWLRLVAARYRPSDALSTSAHVEVAV
ncbi:MAB_1171c family putative transporter [Streptomyces sp. NPDC085665]|uniref:MAB_1171c family putative transporter n=1 Tax=Streptomyces sp. NPDC085665 TaxID=3365735 RepID=UPI0037CE5FB8